MKHDSHVDGSQTRRPTAGADDELRRTDAGGNPGDGGASPLRQFITFLAEAGLAIIVALVITALLRVFVFQVFQVPSGSMERTLEQRDRIVAVRLADFRRGDIVVFEDPPGQWMGPQPAATNPIRRALESLYLLPDSTQGYLVKRVIGMPGDHVACCDQSDRITVNGVALDESEYLYADAAGQLVKPSEVPFDVVVPADHIFVLGDHRDRSGDARLHLCEATAPGVPAGMNGFVPVDYVVGPVVATVLPPGRWHLFSTPDTFTGVPPALEAAPQAPILGEGTCQSP